MSSTVFALGAACAYVVGSIPISKLASHLVSKVLPFLGYKTKSLARVLTNIAKGFLAVSAFCAVVGHEYMQFGMLFAYLGHMYPMCPKCRGGNGVGLLLGGLIALDPTLGLIALLTWLFTYYVFRYATLSALVATVLTPIFAMKVEVGIDILILYLIAALIFLRMRVSLQLLLRGEERMVLWRVENA